MAAEPFVIGLTGSIGMGKTQTAKLFAAEGIPVFDADAAIHRLYSPDSPAIPIIAAEFPTAVTGAGIDRAELSRLLLQDDAALARLETLIHPFVARERAEFLKAHPSAPIVLFDVPLLLETGTKVDAVVVASAPTDVQRDRVLARSGMTEEKFARLLTRQLSDTQKRAQAHYIVVTDGGLDHARQQVKMILAEIREKLKTN